MSLVLKLKFTDQEEVLVPCESFGFTEYESFLVAFGDETEDSPVGFFNTQNLIGFTVHYESEKEIVWN